MTFNSRLNLNSLDGSNGFVIVNDLAGIEFFGASVRDAGDFNGDGIGDILIGAQYDDENDLEAYLIFGTASGFVSPFNLSQLNGSNGFRITDAKIDVSDVDQDGGLLVSGIGDFNGDGFDDIAIAGGELETDPAFAHVIYGSNQPFGSAFSVTELMGSNGFSLSSTSADTETYITLSASGDVNGDGFSDFILGAPSLDEFVNGEFVGDAESVFVIFGRSGFQDNTLILENLDGMNGFKLTIDRGLGQGFNNFGSFGDAIAYADINADGFDDVLVSSEGNAPTYVVYGQSTPFASSLDVSELNGVNGFKIEGQTRDDIGDVIRGVGDLNHDGIQDIAVSDGYSSTTVRSAYVIFGSSTGFGTSFNVTELNGSNGFRIPAPINNSQFSNRPKFTAIDRAGDLNGDGIDDLILGVSYARNSVGQDAGQAYVVFGRSDDGFGSVLDLNALDGSNGFVIDGVSDTGDVARDGVGAAVSFLGDVNGDGADDVIVGAPRVSEARFNETIGEYTSVFGKAYVIFGQVTDAVDGGGGTGNNGDMLPEDNAGESLDTARDLGVLSATPVALRDFIGVLDANNADLTDIYRFELQENSRISLSLRNLNNSAGLSLLNADGSLRQSTTRSNADQSLIVNLLPGVYFFQVDSSDSITPYNMEVSAIALGQIPPDNAGNDFDNARNLGALSQTPITVNDAVGDFNGLSSDPTDFYEFELTENSTLNLALTGLDSLARYTLFNGDRLPIATGQNSDNDQLLTRNFAPGTYFVQISGLSTTTPYQLELSALNLGEIPEDTAGETIEKARDLGILSDKAIILEEYIGNFFGIDSDFADFYRFELSENSTVNLQTRSTVGTTDIQLYNENGEQIRTSNIGRSDLEENFLTGVYYVRVLGGEVNSNGISNGIDYSLSISANPIGEIPVDTAGETIETARDLGVLSDEAIILDEYIGNFFGLDSDGADFYRFELSENSTVNLQTSSTVGSTSIQLYDENGERIRVSNIGRSGLEENFLAGVYYVGVGGGDETNSNGINYQLSISASSIGEVPEDTAGETFDTARDLGVIGETPIAVNEFLGDFNDLDFDGADIYQFSLNEDSSIELILKSSDGSSVSSTDVSLWSETRQVISSANRNEPFTANLRAGNYFLVFSSSERDGRFYEFDLKANVLDFVDKAGNTLEDAKDIGVLNGTQSLDDFIGKFFDQVTDENDFYRFEVTEPSTFNLEFEFFSPEIPSAPSVNLLGSEGQFITSTRTVGTAGEAMTSLEPGIYYLQVSHFNPGGTIYNLTATGTPIPDGAGNGLNTARDLGILKGTRNLSDYVGRVDSNDFYRFELSDTSSFSLGLVSENFQRRASLTLLNQFGSVIGSTTTTFDQVLSAGEYYVRIQGGETNYDVAFSAIPQTPDALQIEVVTPATGSNLGETTLTIRGNQFTNAAEVNLVDNDGVIIAADAVVRRDANTLTAAFNLVGLDVGAYDVQVIDALGTATAEDLFQVTAGIPGKLEVFISAPSAVRAGSGGEVVVTYRNSGGSDLTAPLLTLNAEGALFQEEGEFNDSTVQFLAISKTGDAGVLAPGQTGTFSVRFRSNVGAGNIDFTVNSLATDETVDWDAIRDSSRPETIPAETWAVIFQNFRSQVGDQAGEYEQVLAENASRLSELGQYVSDVSRLIGFELQQGNSQAIFERFTESSFGRGWNNPWEITATENADGDVVIANGSRLRFFERQGDGTYQGDEEELGTLTQADNQFSLRESDGTRLLFLENGQLASIVDTNGNEVVAGYTDDQLTQLTYSNGDVVSFAYNAAGKISEVTDPFGQKTTYTYDEAGELLLSVTDETGTVSYTYETEGAKANAIRSITFADGSQVLYEYDDQGRVTKESRNGGAETVTYAYDSAGRVTVTDAEGNSAQLSQNADGQISRTVDALGRTVEYQYDDIGNLTRITTPNGDVSSFEYDERGNLLRSIDPLGQEVAFTYDREFDQILSVVDQRGNRINYTYDAAGNLEGIVYEDGSGETYQYNERGEVVVSVNRRGQAINYSYDERGNLTKKAFSDGTEATFEYDERSNLTQAVDSDSRVDYEYDLANRLTKVTYGTGRFLEFSYDEVGRRSRMVDQDGFTTNYLYDEVGRLKQLTDQDNANVITYSYDVVGRLAREDNGNGTYSTYAYDEAGQVLSIVHHQPDGDINSRFDYTYDEQGLRTSMTTLEGTTRYGYDATGQLTSVELPTGRLIVYEYDAAGNRISVTDDGVKTNYVTNNLNQYSAVGNATYSYDADGNLVSKVEDGQTWTYTYDVENRLVGVTTPDGVWAYEYDALGNRTASVDTTERTDYLIDPIENGNVVGEFRAIDSARYRHGLGLVSQVNTGVSASFYDADAIGSIVGLTGRQGQYLNQYSYLPFGDTLSKTENLINPFEFVGQYGVMNEDQHLNFVRARYYSIIDGRFLSLDPSGIKGGINLYQYVSNSPLNLVDINGEIQIPGIPPGASPGGQGGGQRPGGQGGGQRPGGQGGGQRPGGQGGGQRPGGQGGGFRPPPPPGSGIRLDIDAQKALVVGVGVGVGVVGIIILSGGGAGALAPAIILFPLLILPPPAGAKEEGRSSTSILRSSDPNDIIGPAGFGDQNWLTPAQTLPYTIRFENLATATAAAVLVTITHTLDEDLDLSTFQLGDFGFSDLIIDIPEGFQNYTTRLDLRDTIGDYVDFEATLDPTTRQVTWTLTTIDPITGELADGVEDGFLPPNLENGQGEGFVNYRINAKSDSPTGTRIDAEARIIFDSNEPIDTPPIFNTLDADTPTSQVQPLNSTVPANFTVTWNGNDNGSGIASYDIFVAIDGGDYTLWLNDTTDTSATYSGDPGKTYEFYSIATDNVGYTEDAPASADASTRANHAPSLTTPISDQTHNENEAYRFTLPTNTFSDTDTTDTLTYSATLPNGDPLPDWLTFDPITQTFSGTPSQTHVGTLNIQITATDPTGESATDTFNLTINPVNLAPTLTNKTFTLPEKSANTTTVGTLPATDPDGDPLTYSITNGNIDLDGDNILPFSITATGEIKVQDTDDLDIAKQPTFNLEITATDPDGLSATATATINLLKTASSVGDPHFTTFDGHYYHFQGAGEFLLTQSLTSDLEVQVQQSPWRPNPKATVNTAVATEVDGHRIQLFVEPDLSLTINDTLTLFNVGDTLTLGSGSITRSTSNTYIIEYASGERLTTSIGGSEKIGHYLNPHLSLLPGHQVRGLLGNNDGDLSNDLVLADGTLLDLSTHLPSEGVFADSWRILPQDSFFTLQHPPSTPDTTPNRDAIEYVIEANGLNHEIVNFHHNHDRINLSQLKLGIADLDTNNDLLIDGNDKLAIASNNNLFLDLRATGGGTLTLFGEQAIFIEDFKL